MGGVASCLKHFPGHGNTTVDSHVGLPVLDTTPEQWLIPDVNGNWNFRLRARTPCRAWLDNGTLRSTANGQLGTGLHSFLAIRRRGDFMDLQATVTHTTGTYKVEATAVRMVVP